MDLIYIFMLICMIYPCSVHVNSGKHYSGTWAQEECHFPGNGQGNLHYRGSRLPNHVCLILRCYLTEFQQRCCGNGCGNFYTFGPERGSLTYYLEISSSKTMNLRSSINIHLE